MGCHCCRCCCGPRDFTGLFASILATILLIGGIAAPFTYSIERIELKTNDDEVFMECSLANSSSWFSRWCTDDCDKLMAELEKWTNDTSSYNIFPCSEEMEEYGSSLQDLLHVTFGLLIAILVVACFLILGFIFNIIFKNDILSWIFGSSGILGLLLLLSVIIYFPVILPSTLEKDDECNEREFYGSSPCDSFWGSSSFEEPVNEENLPFNQIRGELEWAGVGYLLILFSFIPFSVAVLISFLKNQEDFLFSQKEELLP